MATEISALSRVVDSIASALERLLVPLGHRFNETRQLAGGVFYRNDPFGEYRAIVVPMTTPVYLTA